MNYELWIYLNLSIRDYIPETKELPLQILSRRDYIKEKYHAKPAEIVKIVGKRKIS